MSEQKAFVPLSQRIDVGQRDKTYSERDGIGTATGTTSLKALAAKVLRRDSHQDNSGTRAANSCPTPSEPVGQTFEPVLPRPGGVSRRP